MSEQAFEHWLRTVASGKATMSQRNLKWVEANGGFERLIEIAKSCGVHLVQLTVDDGNLLVAASKQPFTTLC